MLISNLEAVYLVFWISALCAASYLLVVQPSQFEICTRAYWKFLFQPWKVFAFIAATALITVVAPYSGDPTWDYPDSLAISCLTYFLAPWAIGAIFLSIRNRQYDKRLFVAVCMFFVPCWFYDAYILLRDHAYPATWVSNLCLSGSIIVLAGLFWNLAWRPGTGQHFAFTTTAWLDSYSAPLRKLIIPALVIAIPVIAMVLWFVYDNQ